VSQLGAQRDRTFPAAEEWPLTVAAGDRVEGIVDFAVRSGASLTVLGLGEHGASARLRGRETVLRVLRATRLPVLAVPRYAWGVPHSALVGLDFAPSSEQAARTAVRLLGEEGTLFLAHVSPRVVIPQGDSRGWPELVAGGSRAMLETVARRLDAPPGIRIEFASLQGDPATELLAFAEEFDVDMIAAGTSDRSAASKLVLGSVSTKLVRHSSRWVLVSPQGSATRSISER
jgi:nucleotide-binding universal stress UspA family protein